MDGAQTSTSSASSSAAGTPSTNGRGGGVGGGSDFLNMIGTSSSIGGVSVFGQHGGGGELLLGSGTFDSSIGNGYGNEVGSSGTGSGAGAPGGGGGSAFDISDFPSLGGSSGGAGGAGGNNGLAAALRQQQQLLAQQQLIHQGGSGSVKSSNLYRLAMSSSGGNGSGANFNMATEDFPALPGAPNPSGGSGGGSGGSGSAGSQLLLGGTDGGQREVPGTSATSSASTSSFVTAAPSISRASSNVSGVGMYGGDVDGGSNQLDVATLLSGSGLGNPGVMQSSSNPGSTSLTQPPRSSNAPSTSAPSSGGPGSSPSGSGGGSSPGGSALTGDYGLLGLLGVIRMSDADRNALALGSDLTALGLNLNSSDQLYSTFASPWSESPTTREPQYQLPMCYYMQPPALKTGHLSKFQLETLFYIFYALPKDVLQAYAAQELYSREWRYHVESKLWFKRAGPGDGVANTAAGGIQYIYFDINSWERRLFNGNIQTVTSGLLSEDDVRVKFPNS